MKLHIIFNNNSDIYSGHIGTHKFSLKYYIITNGNNKIYKIKIIKDPDHLFSRIEGKILTFNDKKEIRIWSDNYTYLLVGY